MDNVTLFQDEQVEVTLRTLTIGEIVYPLKGIYGLRINPEKTLQIRVMDESFSLNWQSVFQSSNVDTVRAIHDAVGDALIIRHFYTGQYLNLPHYFATYKQVIQRRGIATLPIKADTSWQDLLQHFMDTPSLDFDQ